MPGGQHHNMLPVGFYLENYRIEAILGYGGFGITYQALDEDLQQVVAIKEYLPRDAAFRDQDSTVTPLSESDRETFEWGLERFLDEARTLARFRHPNIVGVRRFLRANGTAYLVMDYCEGESLESVLARQETLSASHLALLLTPLLNALEELHQSGLTHRDIKPANIYLREDGSPVLLDFGAARQALAQHSRSVTAIVTPGYAAFEQYSTKGKQGPWTDIYGLGATLYRCVTGQRPPDAAERMLKDELVPAAQAASGRYPPLLLQRIDSALRLRPEDRPQNVVEWRTGARVASAEDRKVPPKGSDLPRESAGRAQPEVRAKSKPTSGLQPWAGGILVVTLAVASWVLFYVATVNEWSPRPDPAPVPAARPAPPPPPAREAPRPPAPPAPVQEVEDERVSLTVKATPPDAAVRIMKLATRYRAGMVLDPGRYDIEVSAPGYQTHRRWYELRTGEQVLEVVLEQSPERPVARVSDPETVFIRGGTFTMGSPASESGRGSEERQNRVNIGDFWLGKHAVTAGEFRGFVETSGYRTDAERNAHGNQGCLTWEDGINEYRSGRSWRNPGFSQGDEHPVVCVSWNDAQAYVRWLSEQTGQTYRLPTEAEWEYSARAGTTTARHWGNDPNQACRHANVADQTAKRSNPGWTIHECDDGYLNTSPVGNFQANAWGLHDMLGNVLEWTCSVFGEKYGGAEQRCDTGDGSRAVRSSSWRARPDLVRSAVRGGLTPGNRGNDLGFRLARSP